MEIMSLLFLKFISGFLCNSNTSTILGRGSILHPLWIHALGCGTAVPSLTVSSATWFIWGISVWHRIGYASSESRLQSPYVFWLAVLHFCPCHEKIMSGLALLVPGRWETHGGEPSQLKCPIHVQPRAESPADAKMQEENKLMHRHKWKPHQNQQDQLGRAAKPSLVLLNPTHMWEVNTDCCEPLSCHMVMQQRQQ